MYAVNGNVWCFNGNFVEELNRRLKDGWSAHVNRDGRIYYFNHATQTSSWLPPADNWDVKSTGLPYGWEVAIDKDGKQYFINHLNKTTTYEDPGQQQVYEEPPKPREVELLRDPDMGFGFVAGSEKPVIVRFVTEGGPSCGKLLPGDLILKVNGEDVKKAPRDHVIDLVRACKHSVLLCVCQPEINNSSRKSALLSAAKKARLRSHPSRVRFAEGVVINGSPLFSPSNFSSESCIPFMPNVLKVFLENGQTKSFKYDSSTLVQDVLESLQQKLGIKCLEHFSLVVEHIKSIRRNKLTLLNPKEYLSKVAARPGAQHLRCLFRVTFVPKEAYELLTKDPVTFEYLYMQCCNDVVQERFAPELKYDIALRLAALHTQQHTLSSSSTQGNKISVKAVERECGLEHFVPMSLMETMKRKELRKLLGHFLKLNQGLSAPGQKSLTALQTKLHYLRIISELPSYGARCFSANLRDSNVETVILVSPKFGISQISGLRISVPMTLANIEDLYGIVVNREDELSHQVELQMKDPDSENILLNLEDRDSEELVLLLQGYYRLLTNRPLPVQQEKDRWTENAAPPYHTRHTVQSVGWNYETETAAGATVRSTSTMGGERVFGNSVGDPSSGGGAGGRDQSDRRVVDLAVSPPPYQPNKCSSVTGHVGPGTMVDMDMDILPTAASSCAVDRNMNRTAFFQRERDGSDFVMGMVPPSVTSDLRHVVTVEVKDRPTQSPHLTSGFRNDGRGGGSFISDVSHCSDDGITSITILPPPLSSDPPPPPKTESKSEDAIRRVAEMQQIVLNAELYLTEEEGNTDTDRDSSRNDSAQGDLEGVPTLKAADSLLLLTQVGRESDLDEAVKNIRLSGLENDEPSESDTDSLSTPTDSPSHHPVDTRSRPRFTRPPPTSSTAATAAATSGSGHQPPVLRSGSSFGLHSRSYNLPSVEKTRLDRANVQELLHKVHDSQVPYPFAEGALYLDPDIIDLTMIPPPITPDQEEAPTPVSFPPTPFADRMSLEAELSHGLLSLNPLTRKFLKGPHALDPSMGSSTNNGGGGGGPHQNSNKPTTSFIASHGETSTDDDGRCPSLETEEDIDIDQFIASVTVPPPPAAPSSLSRFTFNEHSPIQELTQEEISAFIIPPPPASSSSDSEPEMINRLQSVASTLKRMVEPVSKSKSDQRVTGLDQRERSLTELHESPEVMLSVDADCARGPHCDSSGYETYASSSAVSSMEIKQSSSASSSSRRLLNNSFSDNSSTISCSSTEMAGTQADTEDNTTFDGEFEISPSPLLGINRQLHARPSTAGSPMSSLRSMPSGRVPMPSMTLSSGSNGIIPTANHLPNGVVRTGNGSSSSSSAVAAAAAALITHRSRCPSSSSDDGGNNSSHVGDASTCGSSPRRHSSSIPRHQGSTLPRKGSRTTVTLSSNSNRNDRSSSIDRLSRTDANERRTSDGDVIAADRQWSASIENLAAAAVAATERRTFVDHRSLPSPTSTLTKSQKGNRNICVIGRHNSAEAGSGGGGGDGNGCHDNIIKSPSSSSRAKPSSNGGTFKVPIASTTHLQEDRLSRTLNQCQTVPRNLNDDGRQKEAEKDVDDDDDEACPSLMKLRSKYDLSSKSGGRLPHGRPIKQNGSSSAQTSPVRQSSSKVPRSSSKGSHDNKSLSSQWRPKAPPRTSKSASFNNSNDNDNNNGEVTSRSSSSSNAALCHRDRRDSFYGAEEAIGNMLVRLEDVLTRCSKARDAKNGLVKTSSEEEESAGIEKPKGNIVAITARDSLIASSKHFVTASKLFVKGATESEDRLVECLVQCLAILDQMFENTETMAKCMTANSPLHVHNLIMKVKDVAFTFLQTLQAASDLVADLQSILDGRSVNRLMQQATTLAAVLTALMRTLKAFNP